MHEGGIPQTQLFTSTEEPCYKKPPNHFSLAWAYFSKLSKGKDRVSVAKSRNELPDFPCLVIWRTDKLPVPSHPLKLCKQDYPGSSRCCSWWCGQWGDAPPGGYLWRWVVGASSHRWFLSLISMQTAGLLLKAKELQLVPFLPACRLAGLL